MDNFYKSIFEYADNIKKAVESIEQDKLNQLYVEIKNRINKNSKIFLVGNGGSLANASHISGDYLKSISILNQKIDISCLGDNQAFLTAATNDISYEDAYSILVGTLIKKNDLIIYLSGSGNSMNLIKCAKKAKDFDITQASITAFSGGALKNIVDIPIHTRINDMEIAEDVQMIIFHYLKQKLTYLFVQPSDNFNIMQKYNKRTLDDLIS